MAFKKYLVELDLYYRRVITCEPFPGNRTANLPPPRACSPRKSKFNTGANLNKLARGAASITATATAGLVRKKVWPPST